MREISFRAVLLVVTSALWASLALATGEGDAAGGPEAAKRLATDALRCVAEAEEAQTNADKLAAYRRGLELARRAVAADDHNADAHFAVFATQGKIMLIEGATLNPANLVKANRELERTLDLDPNHADGLAAKGGLYRQLPWVLGGNLAKAEDCLTRSIELNPDAVGARIELAETYRDMGQPERGVSLLETAIAMAEKQARFQRLAEAQKLLREFTAER
jgi:tetratricopeptide (TPR) repeat protein